jgi:NADH:ubiquinone oxidoreductase subunit 5 (subunit L)/multisubunit Na+/H+ antiporter MnhA subunit
MLFVSLALVAAGIGLGWLMYRHIAQRPAEIDPLEQTQPALFRFLENKMWLDQLYDWTIVALAKAAARFSDLMDRHVWDGLVRAFGGLGQIFGIFSANFDERGINAGVDEATGSTRGLGRVMSAWHSGQIQTYLGVVAIGMLALLILYAWLI